MRRVFAQLAALTAVFFHCWAVSHADSCVLYHKRAPVKAVCGKIIDVTGERLKDVELTLTDEKGSVVFRTQSDAKGKFSFRSVPKGDYTPHAAAYPYLEAHRDIRVTNADRQRCHPKIAVKLGVSVCSTTTYIKGIDKPSDLDDDFKQK